MKKNGFTLIEILVVIVIIAIIGLIALVNLQGFGTEQNLKNAALDLVNVLKTAQINSTASLKCNNKDPLYWQTKFTQSGSRIVVDTICQYKNDQSVQIPFTVASKTLPATVLLDQVSGANCQLITLSADNPLTVSFTLLSGIPSFSAFNCDFSLSNELTIGLKDSKKEDIRLSVGINKGGAIYVQ